MMTVGDNSFWCDECNLLKPKTEIGDEKEDQHFLVTRLCKFCVTDGWYLEPGIVKKWKAPERKANANK
jgi:hypothetical protein